MSNKSNKQKVKLNTKNKVIVTALSIMGLLLIIWPFLFINDTHQYPICIANDFFVNSNGYPSDRLLSFVLFIHGISAFVGAFFISIALAVFINKTSLKSILLTLASIIVILIVGFYIYAWANFTLNNDRCRQYPGSLFPDLPLIIDSSR